MSEHDNCNPVAICNFCGTATEGDEAIRAHDCAVSKFHSHDGWYWGRMPDGSVAIYHGDNLVHAETADSWASIVASVSAGGEMDERFYAAQAFHASKGRVAR